MRRKVCIIGAGLCGLTSAFYLKESGIDDFVILEGESEVGGTARTIRKGTWCFDLTGHALHLRNEAVKEFLLERLTLKDHMSQVTRNSSILFEGRYIPYPFQHNLAYLSEKTRDRAVLDFLKAWFNKENPNPEARSNFLDYSLTSLGRTITEVFMRPYNEKLWATPAGEMGIEWMGSFVPHPKLTEVLEGAFLEGMNTRKGYNAHFMYPKKGGIQIISDTISASVSEHLVLNCRVERVETTEKRVITQKGEIHYDILITTMPLSSFLRISGNAELYDALSPRHTIVKAFFASTPKDQTLDYSWIYVPSKQVLPYRIGNFSFFSPDMASAHRDLLYIECSTNSESPNSLPDSDKVLSSVSSILMTNDLELVNVQIIDPAYVVYTKPREATLGKIITYLWNEHRILSTGRYGGWKYDSMEGAIFDGIKAAEKIAATLNKESCDPM